MKVRRFLVIALGVCFLAILYGSMGVMAQGDGPVTLKVLEYFDATFPNAARELDEVWKEFVMV